LRGPGIGVVRVNTDAATADRNLRYAVAAFWALGAGRGWACTATGPDDYEGLPYLPEQAWDLGVPVGRRRARRGARAQRYTEGWAAVNLAVGGTVAFRVPEGLVDARGEPAPRTVRLPPKEGCVFASPSLQGRRPPRVASTRLLSLAGSAGRSGADWFEMHGQARLERGELRLPIRSGYPDWVVSRPWFGARGRTARVHLSRPATQPSAEMLLELRTEGGDVASIGKSGDGLLLRLDDPGGRSDRWLSFDPVVHRWWSIGVHAGGRLVWATSTDGETWHAARECIATGFPRSRVRVALRGGRWAQADSDDEAAFDLVEVVSTHP
jgi:hypothetical protein